MRETIVVGEPTKWARLEAAKIVGQNWTDEPWTDKDLAEFLAPALDQARESGRNESDRARALVARCLDELGDPHPTLDWKAITKLTGDDFIEKMIRRVHTRLRLVLGPDPVVEEYGQWFFYDESWAHKHGPYPTEDAARTALDRYINQLADELKNGKTD